MQETCILNEVFYFVIFCYSTNTLEFNKYFPLNRMEDKSNYSAVFYKNDYYAEQNLRQMIKVQNTDMFTSVFNATKDIE